MATVKRKASGAVVLKNGKVSCGCCEQAGCCMYPAQALVDGLYTVDDLPDQVQIGGYLLQKGGEALAVFPVQVDGAFYATLNEEEAYIYLDNFYWNFGPSVGAGAQECLVDGNIVQDQFADSYTLTYDSDITCESVSATVTRESLCIWRGIADDGTVITLEIEFGSFSDLYAWTTNAPNCGGHRRGVGTPFDRNAERGRLNTPIGNFEDEITPCAIRHTVS